MFNKWIYHDRKVKDTFLGKSYLRSEPHLRECIRTGKVQEIGYDGWETITDRSKLKIFKEVHYKLSS